MNITVGKKAIAQASEKLKNWGRWGKDDQIGTLNHVKPEDVVTAAALIRTGRVFALGIPLDRKGPQTGLFGGRGIRSTPCSPPEPMRSPGGRCGPQHPLRRRRHQHARNAPPIGICSATSSTRSPCDRPRRAPSSTATASASSASSTRDKMVGRGVLLDIARFNKVDFRKTATASPMPSSTPAPRRKRHRRPRRFRHRAHRAAGEMLKRAGALLRRRRAGREVRELLLVPGKGDRGDLLGHLGRRSPSQRTKEANQPWHWVVIPAMGLTMGEMFTSRNSRGLQRRPHLRILFFCGPPLVITGATGSPINPQAIK
jgi:hypothetical protein